MNKPTSALITIPNDVDRKALLEQAAQFVGQFLIYPQLLDALKPFNAHIDRAAIETALTEIVRAKGLIKPNQTTLEVLPFVPLGRISNEL